MGKVRAEFGDPGNVKGGADRFRRGRLALSPAYLDDLARMVGTRPTLEDLEDYAKIAQLRADRMLVPMLRPSLCIYMELEELGSQNFIHGLRLLQDALAGPYYIALTNWEDIGRYRIDSRANLNWRVPPQFSSGLFDIQDEVGRHEVQVDFRESPDGQWVVQFRLVGSQLLTDEVALFWLKSINNPSI